MKTSKYLICLIVLTVFVCYSKAQADDGTTPIYYVEEDQEAVQEEEVYEEEEEAYEEEEAQEEEEIYYAEEEAKEEEEAKAADQCYCKKADGLNVYYVKYQDSYQLRNGQRLDSCYDYYKYAEQWNYIPESGWYWARGGWKLYCEYYDYNYWMVYAKSNEEEYDYRKTYNQYATGFRYDNSSYWLGHRTLRYYCNEDYPCKMWIHYCGDYELCYDIYYSSFWLGDTNTSYLLYWSGLQISWEHREAAPFLLAQNGKEWSSYDEDTSNCAQEYGGGWYGEDECKGLRFTADGLCIDVGDNARCYRKWWIKVARYYEDYQQS